MLTLICVIALLVIFCSVCGTEWIKDGFDNICDSSIEDMVGKDADKEDE